MNANVTFRETGDTGDESCAKDERWNDESREWTQMFPFLILVMCVLNLLQKTQVEMMRPGNEPNRYVSWNVW